MTSSISSAQKRQTEPSMWEKSLPFMSPPVAAATAIVPVFWAFVWKTMEQLGQARPKMTLLEAVKGGIGVAPSIALTVGTQGVAMKAFESLFGENGTPTVFSKVGSSVTVAALSVPFLAVFNGKTNGMGARESLKRLNKFQGMALLGREVSFLGSLSLSGPGSEAMKHYLGDSKAMEYVSTMMIGFVGSLAGHPADTCFTRLQNGKPVGVSKYITPSSIKDLHKHVLPLVWKDTKSLYQGGVVRAVAVSGFSAGYKAVNEAFSK